MSFQLPHKKTKLSEFTVHYIYFKNIGIGDYPSMLDMISELIYELGIALIEQTVIGNSAYVKATAKKEKKCFGEPNWPLHWLIGDDENLSGVFVGISGATVKTIVSDNFINKIIETESLRFCYTGQIKAQNTKANSNIQLNEIKDEAAKALLISGMSSEHVIKTQTISSSAEEFELEKTNKALLTSKIWSENQYHTSPLCSAWSLSKKNEKLTVSALDSQINATLVTLKDSKLLFTANPSDENNKYSSTSEYVHYCLLEIEKLLEQEDLSWPNMVKGLLSFENKQDLKYFKALCKDKKIPLSSILFISIDENTTLNGFSFSCDFSS